MVELCTDFRSGNTSRICIFSTMYDTWGRNISSDLHGVILGISLGVCLQLFISKTWEVIVSGLDYCNDKMRQFVLKYYETEKCQNFNKHL